MSGEEVGNTTKETKGFRIRKRTKTLKKFKVEVRKTYTFCADDKEQAKAKAKKLIMDTIKEALFEGDVSASFNYYVYEYMPRKKGEKG